MIQFLLNFRFFFFYSARILIFYIISLHDLWIWIHQLLFMPSIPTRLYKRSSVRIYFVGLQPWVVCPVLHLGRDQRGVCALSVWTMSIDRHGLFCRLPLSLGMELNPVLKWCWQSQKLLMVFSFWFLFVFMKQQQKQTQSARPELLLSSEPTHQQHGNEAQTPQGGVLIGREFCDKVGNTCRDCRSPCPLSRWGVGMSFAPRV